jgi:hypothetical protein
MLSQLKNNDEPMLVDFNKSIEDFLSAARVDSVVIEDLNSFSDFVADGAVLYRLCQRIFPQSLWVEFPFADVGFSGLFHFQKVCNDRETTARIKVDAFDILNRRKPLELLEALDYLIDESKSTIAPTHSEPSDESGFCFCLSCRWRDAIRVIGSTQHAIVNSKLPSSVRRLVFDGITVAVREHAWLILSGGLRLMRTRKPEYISYFPKAEQLCAHLDLIDLDIARTYQEYPEFRAKLYEISTRRILAAYSLRNPSVGYCQGLSYIVGLLVTVVNEELAFVILCAIIEDGLLPPDYYTSLKGAMIDQQVLETLISSELPALSAIVENMGDYSFVSIPWNMCLFSTAFPMPVSVRVWDFLFTLGPCVLFKISLGLWRELESELVFNNLPVSDIRSKLSDIEQRTNINDISLYCSEFPSVTNENVESIRDRIRASNAVSSSAECQMSVRDAAVVDESLNSCVSDQQFFGSQDDSRRSTASSSNVMSSRRSKKIALRGLSQFMADI